MRCKRNFIQSPKLNRGPRPIQELKPLKKSLTLQALALMI